MADRQGEPLAGCHVWVVSLPDSLEKKFTVSDNNGAFALEKLKQGDYGIGISAIGFSDYTDQLSLKESIDLGTVTLQESTTALDEVTVTASMVKRFADKREYKLTQDEKNRYGSALAALESLPKVQVMDQTVTAIDGKAVKILINGIPSTPVDLSVIPPDDIAKIDYYTQPPIRYANMGLGAVINVVTHAKQTGGSLALNTQNALTTGFGNNVVDFNYNHGRSQIGVKWGINYRNYHKRVLDEQLAYTIGGKAYDKQKRGTNSPYAYEQHMAELRFNHTKTDDYLLSAKLSLGALNRRRSSTQRISATTDGTRIEQSGRSSDKDNYLSPVLDLYFSKLFHDKHELVMNVVGTYYKSGYDYDYTEVQDDVASFQTATHIHTHKYSLIGETVYNYKMRQAQLYIGSRYMYNNSVQKDLPAVGRILTNEVYGYAGVSGTVGKKFNYSVSAGINGNLFTTTQNVDYKSVYFRPQVKWGYFIDPSSDVTFNYEVNTQNPSVSTLTYNPYYKDADYLSVGNPDLKPGNSHDFSLSYYKGFKRLVVNAELGYTYTQAAIAPVFRQDDAAIVETYGNLDNAQNIGASLFWQWYPFAGNLLRLRLYAEVFHQTAALDDASWHHTGYVVIPSLYIAYKRWGFQVMYQTERKTLTGQTLKNTPSMASVELTYNPAKHLQLTAGIRYPFYNAWKQTTSVYGTALLSRAETERIKNNANMVYINLVYNLPFGKSGAAAKRKMNNADKDSGILSR